MFDAGSVLVRSHSSVKLIGTVKRASRLKLRFGRGAAPCSVRAISAHAEKDNAIAWSMN